MLSVLANWLYIAVTTGCIGVGAAAFIQKKLRYQIKHADTLFAIGLVDATVYAELFSLFYKVGVLANLVFIVLCLSALLYGKKQLCLFKPASQDKKRIANKTLALLIVILIFAYCTSRGYMHYDSDLYHAQSIRWIEEYGVVKGLGNIHVRFAYNSSIFAISALYSMPYIFGQSMHCVNGFFALLLSVESLRIVRTWERRGLLLSDFARAGALFYLTLIYKEIMAPASDYAIMCTVFYIVIKWLSLLETKQEAITPYALLCVAGVYAVSLKLTAGLILLLTCKPTYLLIRQKRWREISGYIALGIVVLVPWIARTAIISGYLLYPFPALDVLAVDWKIPAQTVALDAAEIKTWGRGLNNAALVDVPIWQWGLAWFQGLAALEKLFILSDICCLLLGIVYFTIVLCQKRKLQKDMALVWLAAACSYMFWQLSAPLLRYGYAYVLLLIALTTGVVWEYAMSRICTFSAFAQRLACTALLLLGVIKLCGLGGYIADTAEQPYYVNQQDYGTYALASYEVNGVTFYYPVTGDRTGYAAFPAIPRETKIIFRGETLKEGFRQ